MSEQEIKNSKGKKKLTKKQRRKRKIIAFSIELVLLLILLGGLYVWSKMNKIEHTGSLDKEKVATNLNEVTQEMLKGYTNIALFGLDNRTNGSYSSGNSDCIMVASINNDTNEVRLVSIYRDTYMDVEDETYRKINSAYGRGGAEAAVKALNKNLDLDIEQYVCVDFNALSDVIDALGGIELEITNEEAAVMNGQTGHEDYIQENMDVTGKVSQHVSGGYQTLDGVQATAYCRIRYTSGDDFKRTERQRTVLSLMVEKAKSASLGTLNEIIDSVFSKIETSLTSTEIIGLASNLMEYELVDTQGFPFNLTTGSFGSLGDMVVPATLESNVADLHEYLFGAEDYEPSNTLLHISDYIIDATGVTEEDAIINNNPLDREDDTELTTEDDTADDGSSDTYE